MLDYYQMLNIDYAATNDDIKRAFRQLALKLHPDNNSGNRFLSDQFKMIEEAYRTLIDSEKRANYDKRIGIRKEPILFSEDQIKKLYEYSITLLSTEVYRDVYSYLLEKTNSKYISKIISDAAIHYIDVQKENEKNYDKGDDTAEGTYEICPKCKMQSEKRFNVCEHCHSFKDR